MSNERDTQKTMFLEKQTQNQKIAWDAAVKIHKTGMTAYFEAYINTPEVLELAKYANSADERAKNTARQKLYKLLLPTYSNLQLKNVKQLHFHDKQNNSFLRFHLPYRFGDSLNSTRPSVVLANKNKKAVRGFETGRAISGFRNIFPLFYNKEHIGSVELSQPFDAIRAELVELDANKDSVMVLRATEVLPKIFDEQKRFYKKSGFSDEWLVEDPNGWSSGNGILSSLSVDMCKALKNSKEFKAKLNSGLPFSYEYSTKDGNKFVVTATPVLDIDGKYAGALLSFMSSAELQAIDKDFTVHLSYFTFMLFAFAVAFFWLLHNRKVLDAERKHLAAITSMMGEGLYVVDMDGRIRYINDSALDMLGLAREGALGVIAHYLFHSHKHNTELKDCPVHKTVSTGEKYNGIEHFRRQDGESIVVDIVSSALKNDDGQIVGAITVFKDISERIRLEEDLKALNAELNMRVEREVSKRIQSDALFKNIFDNSPEGILILDQDAVFVECNSVAAAMLGCSPKDIIGKKPQDISPEIQPETGFFSEIASRMFLDGALGGKVQRFEWSHTKKDGGEVMTEVMLSRMSRNDTLEVLVLWRDITEIKRLQSEQAQQRAALIQQSKLAEVGSMIGAIAHQWKQPINAISIIVQDLAMCYEDGELTPEEMKKYKNDIREQISFMTQTIEDFRNFYKPSRGVSTFYIAKAVNSVLSLLKNQLKNENILLSLEIDDTLLVRGFESELQQVILSIVNNAVDAFLERGVKDRKLHIAAFKTDESKVTLRITDNAGGISEELLKDGKIFNPYNTTKGEKGTGVGLSLSKIIIEKSMGGTLRVRNVDGGVEFSIELSCFNT